jgi:hypothetical protein
MKLVLHLRHLTIFLLWLGFFGDGDGSFLWRMRYNRNSKCHSLFEQAQMETDIDVYSFSGLNSLVQHCSHNRIGIGGGDLNKFIEAKKEGSVDDMEHDFDVLDSCGFGIMLDEDLSTGSTGPCATYRNPCLLDNSAHSETFEIMNMEVWTLTPAWDESSAQKMEMVKYFSDQSTHTNESVSVHSVYSDITASSPRTPSLSSKDYIQQSFYRRLGENDESEANRMNLCHP